MYQVRVTKDGCKLRFTIPAKIIREMNAKFGDYLKIIINGREDLKYYIKVPKICPSRTNLQTKRAIPQNIVKLLKIKDGDILNVDISLVDNYRSENLIVNSMLDILATTPRYERDCPIMIDLEKENGEEFCNIWYCSGQGGNAKLVRLKRYIKIDRQLGEFFGLMQAESRKNGPKFDFTNNLLLEHELFMNIGERFGISKALWNYQLFFNSNMDNDGLNKDINKIKKMFNVSKKIILTENNLLNKVALTIYIDSNLLAVIMINLMKILRKRVADRLDDDSLKEFAIGFVSKDLLGDGTVVSRGGEADITISEQDLCSQKDIVKIFENLGIRTSIYKNRILLKTDLSTYLWFIENKVFEGHKNREKIVKSILSNYYVKSLYGRFKGHDFYTAKDLSEKFKLKKSTAYMFLLRNKRRGFLTSKEGYFMLTNKGREFIEMINKAKNELTNLS